MARRRKANERLTGAPCPICQHPMTLKSTIPAAHIFPALMTFQCQGCGNRRTVENEAELSVVETAKAAA